MQRKSRERLVGATIYELSLRELDVSPAESVFVGDGGSNELEGAKHVGMATIMITGINKELRLDRIAVRQRHADFVIERLVELTDHMQLRPA